MDLQQFKALFLRTIGNKDNPYHPLVWINGEPRDEVYVPRRYRDTRSMAEMIVPAGEYFVMGDHRSISSDSRDFGPVDRDLIYGKATFIYWPADNMGVVR